MFKEYSEREMRSEGQAGSDHTGPHGPLQGL